MSQISATPTFCPLSAPLSLTQRPPKANLPPTPVDRPHGAPTRSHGEKKGSLPVDWQTSLIGVDWMVVDTEAGTPVLTESQQKVDPRYDC